MVDDLKGLFRVYDPEPGDLLCDLFWADPHDGNGFKPARRDCGQLFGTDITEDFLKRNELDFMIRSHETMEMGYYSHQNGKCITIFSAPNYK